MNYTDSNNVKYKHINSIWPQLTSPTKDITDPGQQTNQIAAISQANSQLSNISFI